MRHGEADTRIQQDYTRPLTPHGEQEAIVMSSWFLAENIKIDAIISSPFKRAQQTAHTIAKQLRFDDSIQTLDLLTPSGSATQVHDYLDAIIDIKGYKNVLLVSHMPLVSYLLAALSFEKNAPIFATAAIAQIEYDCQKMSGQVVNYLTPDNLI